MRFNNIKKLFHKKWLFYYDLVKWGREYNGLYNITHDRESFWVFCSSNYKLITEVLFFKALFLFWQNKIFAHLKNKSENIKVSTARCNFKYKEMEESVHRARAFPFTNTVNSEQNGKSGKI